MTAAEALRAALPVLHAAGVEAAARDARLLLAQAMAIAPDRLTLHLRDPLSDAAAARFTALLQRRAARQPMAQILGQRLFWGRAFTVTRHVLDPRPETETLIALAGLARFDRVLDLGTGSGCLLATLLLERPEATGTGVDICRQALGVARGNCDRLGVGKRADLQSGDWFGPVRGRFDLIVSNPPYIAASEMPGLAPEVRDWEPHLALTPGGDGLAAYRAIAAGARAYLAPGGRLLVEIGPTQGAAVTALMQAAGLAGVAVHPDLDGRDRVVAARAE